MQYSLPPYEDRFVGDPMPWWDGDTFHLFYLLDEGHHSANNGLGGHQWAHSSTKDLVNWTHHPLAIPLGEPGEFDWTSICTGSLFEHEGTVYASYATRVLQENGEVHEAVGLSTSADGVDFTKHPGNPILWPSSPYRHGGFRDPCVFEHGGRFHMLVTGELEGDRCELERHCMAHFESDDLLHWEPREPILVPGTNSAVECPDLFEWNGWYYVTWLEHGAISYRMSREPFGPWKRPAIDTFDGGMWAAAKSARFGDDRRLAVGFLRWRDADDGPMGYAGNAVFRELVQEADGTLSAILPEELLPEAHGRVEAPASVELDAQQGITIERLARSEHCRITCVLEPGEGTHSFGVLLRANDACDHGYELTLRPAERTAVLQPLHTGGGVSLSGFDPARGPLRLDVMMLDDIIDVSIRPIDGTHGARCLVGRFPDAAHDGIALFARDGRLRIRDVEVSSLA